MKKSSRKEAARPGAGLLSPAYDAVSLAASRTRAWSGYLILLLGVLMLLAVLRSALFGSISPEKHIWVDITLFLLIALVAERLVQSWQQPFVMVLLVLGVLISNHTLSVLWPFATAGAQPVLSALDIQLPSAMPTLMGESELISTFANLGVIILLFRIGLHSKLELVFNLKNLLIALGGVILPFAIGFLYAQSSGGSFAYSLFVGAALTATSVGITAAVLEEMALISKPFAQAILGAAVIDDILALMVLGLIKNVPTTLSAESLSPFALLIAVALVFVVSGIALGKLFISRFFSYEEGEISKRTLSGLLAILFFYSFAAESLGLSAIVGAFLAGLVIGFSPLADKLNRALFSLDVLFTPVFFISLGMLVDVWAIPAILVPLLVLTLIAILGKMVGCALPARLCGMNWGESVLVGFGMVPRGEIALIIALLGLGTLGADGLPIITAAQYTLIASMAFVTTAIAPWGMRTLIARFARSPAGG
ncbi:MAG: cation:proton antiporter [Candidatus Micrarchaeota archaeon]